MIELSYLYALAYRGSEPFVFLFRKSKKSTIIKSPSNDGLPVFTKGVTWLKTACSIPRVTRMYSLYDAFYR